MGVCKTDSQVVSEHSARQPNGCIIWFGATNKGYGKLTRHGRTWGAHRFAWTISRGPIPEGMVIDHLCRTPLCVNVAHMEVVTIQVNTLRGVSSSAFNAVKTHCKRGHEFTPDNIYWIKLDLPRPGRECKTCKRLHVKAARIGMKIDAYLASLEDVAA